MLVHQILKMKASSDVAHIRPDATVSDAARRLSELGIGSLVVSSDGDTVAGIISERDIVRELGRRGPECLSEPVSNLMTERVMACVPEDSDAEVLQLMTNGRFRHMPVLDSAGQMVGLISIGDVVKARLEELGMEKAALEGMIMGR